MQVSEFKNLSDPDLEMIKKKGSLPHYHFFFIHATEKLESRCQTTFKTIQQMIRKMEILPHYHFFFIHAAEKLESRKLRYQPQGRNDTSRTNAAPREEKNKKASDA